MSTASSLASGGQPPPENAHAPAHLARGASAELRQGQHSKSTTVMQLQAVLDLLPTISLETRVALDVARDLHMTGGCETEDGKRLATAYKRLKRACEVVRRAEQEVAR